ncbi:MAG: hypothetical protein NUV75_02080 [Gallionella sp.]|nr:hypothetical protein [Gallionella sp.]
MGQYRKKPVVIEARVVTRRGAEHTAKWCNGLVSSLGGIDIETLEGIMHAAIGDFVIRGVKGEFYPCKPDIFAATYEPVATDPEK